MQLLLSSEAEEPQAEPETATGGGETRAEDVSEPEDARDPPDTAQDPSECELAECNRNATGECWNATEGGGCVRDSPTSWLEPLLSQRSCHSSNAFDGGDCLLKVEHSEGGGWCYELELEL